MADSPPYPGAPPWVKVSGIIGGVLVLFVAILILAGGGHGRHLLYGDAGGQTPPSRVTKHGVQQP